MSIAYVSQSFWLENLLKIIKDPRRAFAYFKDKTSINVH